MTASTSTAFTIPVRVSLRVAFCAVLASFALAGCTPPSQHDRQRTQDFSDKVSVQQLSQQLGLTVVRRSASTVMLKNSANTVLLYSDPNGQAYVNCRPVGGAGGFESAGDTMYIPRETVGAIRASLRPNVVVQVSQNIPNPPSDPGHGGNRATGKVVIDAGHGGNDPGTNGHGANEKSINLALALAVSKILRQRGVDTVLTRSNDTFIELDDRCDIANRSGAKLFVSIHINASKKASNRGHEVLVPDATSPKANLAAQDISKELTAAGMAPHGSGVRKDDRGLRVLRHTDIPAVLVEVGFLSNSADAAIMTDRSRQQRIAEGIADGIIDYLNGK